MKTKTLVILAAVGVGGYFLFTKVLTKAPAAPAIPA